MNRDFERFAISNGIGSGKLSSYDAYASRLVEPVILEERKTHCAPMSVFSRLLLDRIIFLSTPIDDDVASIIQAELLWLAAESDDDISMYINTPGGQVSSGLGIYDTMQLVRPSISTTCTGMAASMGSVILCAGDKGKRAALPHSRVLIHQPLGGAHGQASDIEIAAREIVKTKDELYRIIAEHSGQDIEKIIADADRDYWMTAQEALDYGMIDKICAASQFGK